VEGGSIYLCHTPPALPFTGQPSGSIFSPHDHRSLRSQTEPRPKKRLAVPAGRIVTAKLPCKRHYGLIRDGLPDEAQRMEQIRQFVERTLKGEPQG
jgi:hypothetical protein